MLNFNKSYTGLRKEILQNIEGQGLVVLDVGCANGELGNYLLNNNISKEVYGIEIDSKMAQVAKINYNKVFEGNLDDLSFLETIIQDIPYCDYIIFGDILEHLKDPEIVLKCFVTKLKLNGRVIISLPNIAHIELLINIYFKGSWPKNDRGIFDKTHLRWFTKKDALKLCESSGLKLISYNRIYRSRDKLNSKFTLKYKLIKLINKDLVTFQHLIVSFKNG